MLSVFEVNYGHALPDLGLYFLTIPGRVGARMDSHRALLLRSKWPRTWIMVPSGCCLAGVLFVAAPVRSLDPNEHPNQCKTKVKL